MTISSESKGKKKEELETIQMKRILVPIDGSSYSMTAAKYAIEIAKLQKAQILCIHVIEELPYGTDFIGSAVEQYFNDISNLARSWFKEIMKMAKDEGIDDIETDVFTDIRSTAEAITNYASNKSVDLIVIGTKGRTGFQRLLLGSVANGVVQHAHCSVLTIK